LVDNHIDTDTDNESRSAAKKPRAGVAQEIISNTSSLKGVYYKRCYADELISASVGDLVVRLRTEEERKNGKRDKFDLFNSLWHIIKFDNAEKIYSVEDNDSNVEIEYIFSMILSILKYGNHTNNFY
jgi:hypothetical protein